MPTTQDPTRSAAEDFFSPLENTKPWLKLCVEGDAGSGKSTLAASLAIGLHKLIKSQGPVTILDTERASKFSLPLFKEAGVEAVVKESRSLADVKKARELCISGYSSIMITDSVTNIYQDFEDAFLRKKNRPTMQIQDYKPVRKDWRQIFVQPLVDAPLHCIDTGRVNDDVENFVNDDGDKEFRKVGVKMEGGKKTEHEYDIVILMQRMTKLDQKTGKLEVWRQATVIKGRGGLQDGQVIKNPSFKDFEATIKTILENGVERTVTEQDAAELIKTEDNKREYIEQKEIALEKVKEYLEMCFPGTSADAKASKRNACYAAFGGKDDIPVTWLEIEKMPLKALQTGFEALREHVKSKTLEAKPE